MGVKSRDKMVASGIKSVKSILNKEEKIKKYYYFFGLLFVIILFLGVYFYFDKYDVNKLGLESCKESDTNYCIEEGNIYYQSCGGMDIYHCYKYILKPNLKTFEVIKDRYAKDQNYIYCGGYGLKGAKVDSFEILDKGSRDKYNMYYNCKLIDKADPNTFKFLYFGYEKDEKYVYRKEKIINGADSISFKVFKNSGGYAKDKNNLYKYGKIVEGFDLESFEPINYRYVKDKKGVYYLGTKIKGSDPSTFISFSGDCGNYRYSKDKNNVYFSGKKIDGADSDSFEEVELCLIAKDKDYYYRDGKKILGIDMNTFEIIDEFYQKDKNYIYYFFNKIEGSDGQTFQLLGGQYVRDKNNVYDSGDILEGEDPNTFEVYSDRLY